MGKGKNLSSWLKIALGCKPCAAKIVRTGGKTILKVTPAVWDDLDINGM
jgi:hypothetical protein